MPAHIKKQVIFIHGGETFNTHEEYIEYLKYSEYDPTKEPEKRWKDSFAKELGDDFEVFTPSMPSKYNAKYKEWEIWFQKLLPHVRNDIILVGHSLGGIFLVKYLAIHAFPVKIAATFLVAAPYDDKDSAYSLADFELPESLALFEKQAGKVFIYHSKDDTVVSFSDCKKYAAQLPRATVIDFEKRGHFMQESFLELVEDIKNLP
ncbi:MAG: alpha/beta hydrolase [Parcubacteria group bacterium]|nr:alpha/beta hydrolase [Parcubacteria group bacterium]